MEEEGREEVRQAWMLPPPSVVENYRRVRLHQIQQKANPESLELWEQPSVCAGYLTCTESFRSVKLNFCR